MKRKMRKEIERADSYKSREKEEEKAEEKGNGAGNMARKGKEGK